jgi:hypothetical protein
MRYITRLAIIAALLTTLLCPYCFADSGWMLTTADFRRQSVSLDAIADDGVHVSVPGGGRADSPSVIPYTAFLQLDRSAAPRPSSAPFTLFLLSGDRIGGEPLGIENEQLLWKSPALGELKFSLKSLKALARGSDEPPAVDQVRADDLIVMDNGDSVRGIVTAMTPDTITIEGDAMLDVPMTSVRAMHFALAGNPQAAQEGGGRAFRVRFTDGSSITGPSAQSDGRKLILTLADKTTRDLPLSLIGGIEQLDGPVSWLSSRAPEQVVQVPYFGTLQWPTRMDATVGGRPIQFAGRTYSRGIGVHAYSRIDYALNGGAYAAFRTQYAIAQEEKRQFADVTVRIRIDGATVHEQASVKADTLSPVVLIDFPQGAKKLTLEVDYGQANDTQDRFNWIEPALLREKPAPIVEDPAPTTQPTTRPATVNAPSQPENSSHE